MKKVETWKKLQEKMSRKYHWFCIPTTRVKIKRRAKDAIAVTISKELKEVSARKLS